MDELPINVSLPTIKRARKLADNALKADMNPGTVRWVDNKDMLFFMLTNGPDLCVTFCAPTCYLVEYHSEDETGWLDEDYFMLKNIRNWLFYLKRNGFHDCEHILDKPTFYDDDED